MKFRCHGCELSYLHPNDADECCPLLNLRALRKEQQAERIAQQQELFRLKALLPPQDKHDTEPGRYACEICGTRFAVKDNAICCHHSNYRHEHMMPIACDLAERIDRLESELRSSREETASCQRYKSGAAAKEEKVQKLIARVKELERRLSE